MEILGFSRVRSREKKSGRSKEKERGRQGETKVFFSTEFLLFTKEVLILHFAAIYNRVLSSSSEEAARAVTAATADVTMTARGILSTVGGAAIVVSIYTTD